MASDPIERLFEPATAADVTEHQVRLVLRSHYHRCSNSYYFSKAVRQLEGETFPTLITAIDAVAARVVCWIHGDEGRERRRRWQRDERRRERLTRMMGR